MNKAGMSLLKKTNACHGAVMWAADTKDMREAWDTCQRADWMLWGLEKIDFDANRLRAFACKCVRETPLHDGRKVWDLLTDSRSREAVEVAERYCAGNATRDQLNAAANAAANANAAASNAAANAAAAYAAAYAAYANAANAARVFQAGLLRSMIAWDDVEAAIKAWVRK